MMALETVDRFFGALRGDPCAAAEVPIQRNVPASKWALLVFHLLFVVAWFTTELDLLGALLVWFLIQCGVHAGFHRYYGHRSFRTSPWFEAVLTCLGVLAVQGGPLWWASEHRYHHQKADTDDDFHSPRHGFWHAHMGWLLREDIGDQTARALIPDQFRPIPVWFQRNLEVVRTAYAVSIVLMFGWAGLLSYWVIPVVVCWHTTSLGNSFGHSMGSHPSECPPRGSCSARNNALVALLDLGEGWHNNHHAYPAYAHHGFHKWYQVDIVYAVLFVLEKLGMIWDVKKKRQERWSSTRSDEDAHRAIAISRK
jgi:stearoyl-CoA desaturase (Delta-9 desaturase)